MTLIVPQQWRFGRMRWPLRCLCRVHTLLQSLILAAPGNNAPIYHYYPKQFQVVPTDHDLCVFKIFAAQGCLSTSWLPILLPKILFWCGVEPFCCPEYLRRIRYGDISPISFIFKYSPSALSDVSIVSLNCRPSPEMPISAVLSERVSVGWKHSHSSDPMLISRFIQSNSLSIFCC